MLSKVYKVAVTLSIFILASTIMFAKMELVETRNYYGKDGKWHWVEVYKDTETGGSMSKEWANGDGPYLHTPKKFPHYQKTNQNTEVNSPINISCEFVGSDNGIISIKVDKVVDLEVLKVQDGSQVMPKQPVTPNAGYNIVTMPQPLNKDIPYGLVLYENGNPIYMELFFFNGKIHKSNQEYPPGYDPNSVE